MTNPNLEDVFDDSEETEEAKGEETQEPEKEDAEDKESAPPADKDDEEETEGDSEGKETDDSKEKESKAEPEEKQKDSTTKKEESVPVAALKDERSKRQTAESEVQRLKAKYEPDAEELPDEETYKARSNTSRELMLGLVSDYEEKEKVFLELAEKDPSLRYQLRMSTSPAKFAYDKGKEHMEYQEYKESRNSEEWKEFTAWKSDKAKRQEEAETETPDTKRKKSALTVPNLNKAASAKIDSAKESLESLDDIMEDSPF